MYIFLPSDLGSHGYLVGWWLDDAAVVAGLVSEPSEEVLGVLGSGARLRGDWISAVHAPRFRLQRLWRQGRVVKPLSVQVVRYDPVGLAPGVSNVLDAALPHLEEAVRRRQPRPRQASQPLALALRCFAKLCRWLALGLTMIPARLLSRSAYLTQWKGRLDSQAGWHLPTEKLEETAEEAEKKLLCYFSLLVAGFDAVFGCLAVILMHWHGLDIMAYLLQLQPWVYGQGLVSLVHWLMGAPADFKLNQDLTRFTGSLFLSMFSICESLQVPTSLIRALSLLISLSPMGLSFTLALFMDVLALTSLPIFVAYLGTSLCWKLAIRSLFSLCLLFQGWKYNVLRGRVDHHNFSLEQLLIGVILLSIVVFLLPSLFMFYICFTSAWLTVLLLYSVLKLAVTVSNLQPLCLLLIIFLRPTAWHHGLMLEMEHSEMKPLHAWFRLRAQPPKASDAMEPLLKALELKQSLQSFKALASGTVWRMPMAMPCSLSLPSAKSLKPSKSRS